MWANDVGRGWRASSKGCGGDIYQVGKISRENNGFDKSIEMHGRAVDVEDSHE